MIEERKLVGRFVVSGGKMRIGDVAGDKFLSVNAAVGDWRILCVEESKGVALICEETYEHMGRVVRDIEYARSHEHDLDDEDIRNDVLRRFSNAKAYMDTLFSSNRRTIKMVSGIFGVSERRTWDSELGFLSDASWGDDFRKNVDGYVPVEHGVVAHTKGPMTVICYRNELTGEVEGIVLLSE